jgi:hypothetical protein
MTPVQRIAIAERTVASYPAYMFQGNLMDLAHSVASSFRLTIPKATEIVAAEIRKRGLK